MIEDRINRFDLLFDRPVKDKNRDDIIYAEGEKGMLAKGPNFRMQVIDAKSSGGNSAIASINAFKGSKSVFREDIAINNTDAQQLRSYKCRKFLKLLLLLCCITNFFVIIMCIQLKFPSYCLKFVLHL